MPRKQFGECTLIAAARRIHKLFVTQSHKSLAVTRLVPSICSSSEPSRHSEASAVCPRVHTRKRERPPEEPHNLRHRRVCLDGKS
jgi:hypothetical protein